MVQAVSRGSDSMRSTTAAHWRQVRIIPLVALLLILVGCATPTQSRVVFRAGVEPRLVTRLVRGLFLTDVRIDGRTVGPFLIDSGADRIYLDTSLAKALALPLGGEGAAPGTQPKEQSSTVATLDVGPLSFQGTEVMVTDLSAASGAMKERIVGLLGHPFFARAVVEVDYATQTIACFDPQTYRLPQGTWLPLSFFYHNRPVLRARLEGNIDGQFLLDTGDNGTVSFYVPFAQTHRLLDGRTTRTLMGASVEGTYEVFRGTLAWFEVGGQRFDQLRVDFLPASAHKPASQELAGVIGLDLLRHFTVVFNYPAFSIALLRK